MLQVKVTNVRQGGTKKHVLASARVELTSEPDTVIILDARVLLSKVGKLFVDYPNQSIGRGKYIAIIEFSKELKRRISDAVLVAYEEYRKDQTVCGPGHFPEARQADDPDLDRPLGAPLRAANRGSDGR